MVLQSPTLSVIPWLVFLPLLLSAQYFWFSLVQKHVSEPYLDEVFHIPQAQTYWRGNWTHWDSKITTPPGVYLASYLLAWLGKLSYLASSITVKKLELSPADLRWTNVIFANLLLIVLYAWQRIGQRKQMSEVGDKTSIRLLDCSVVILAFPLLFFFSALYYTDVFSALTVVMSYTAWKAGFEAKTRSHRIWCQIAHLLCGLLSLASRQTNVFWVSVFLGGLQLFETVDSVTSKNQIHDHPMSDARVEGMRLLCSIARCQPRFLSALHRPYQKVKHFVSAVYTLLHSAFSNIPTLIPAIVIDLWPQITLLISFTAFVIYNGGVVLGDKSNHIATIHLAQMLYLWAFMTFFSWPAMLPTIADVCNQSSNNGWRGMIRKFPRPFVLALFLGFSMLIVRYNTIVHPFTLADNRHYVFYIFRLLLRKVWWVRYAAVPIYVSCGWIAIATLGSRKAENNTNEDIHNVFQKRPKTIPSKSSLTKVQIRFTQNPRPLKVSFVLIWLLSTALSLVTAPLVEPRYFIVPWLIWRMNVSGQHQAHSARKGRSVNDKTQPSDQMGAKSLLSMLNVLGDYSLWIEMAWYMLINCVTCYIFLYRGFTWMQEPGAVQRFMY